MKVVFDLDDKLIVTEAQELIGQEGELTIIDSRHTYYIENLSEERAKKLVMEAYNRIYYKSQRLMVPTVNVRKSIYG